MDILSPPAYLEEPVTDIDLRFVGDKVDSIMLRAADTLVITKSEITIEIAEPAESIVITRANLLAYRLKKRIWRYLDPAIAALKNNQSLKS